MFVCEFFVYFDLTFVLWNVVENLPLGVGVDDLSFRPASRFLLVNFHWNSN